MPSPGYLHRRRGVRRVALLPGERQPLASLRYGPLILRPDEPQAWIEASARRDTLPVVACGLAKRRRSRPRPAGPHLVEAEVSGPQGEPIENRLLAFYAFLGHAAVAIVSIPDRSHIAGLRDSLLALLRALVPDWRAEPVCLAEAWDLQPQSASTSLPTSLRQRLRIQPAPTSREIPSRRCPASGRDRSPLANAHPLLVNQDPAAALAAPIRPRPKPALGGDALPARPGARCAGSTPEAIAAWQATLQLQPTHRDATYRLALSDLQRGDYAQALRRVCSARCSLRPTISLPAATDSGRCTRSVGWTKARLRASASATACSHPAIREPASSKSTSLISSPAPALSLQVSGDRATA